MDSAPLPPSSPSPQKEGPTPSPADSGKPIKCVVCDVWCSGVVSYQSHLQGRQHYTKLVKTANGNEPGTQQSKKRPSETDIEILRCEVCDVSCQGKEQYDVHVVGVRHAKKVKLKDVEVDLSTMPFIEDLGAKRFKCTICNVEVTGKVVVLSHIQGIKHQRKADSSIPKPPVTPRKQREKTTPTGEPLECKICKLPVNSLFQLEEHRKSVKHLHKEDAYKKWAEREANLGKDYDAWDPSG